MDLVEMREMEDHDGMGCYQGDHVEGKQEMTKHWTLGDTLGQRGNGGGAVVDVDELFVFVRYDHTQERVVPVMLREDSRR